MRKTISSTQATISAFAAQSQATSWRVSKRIRRLLAEIREHAAGSKAQQSNRNGQKSEVVKKNDGKQAGQRQFEKQGGEAAQGNSGQQSAIS